MIFRFSNFEVDPNARSLKCRGRSVSIQPRPFDLLLYLLKHSDRVIPMEELVQNVWGGLSVSPETVRYAVHSARRALNEAGEQPRVIKTRPGIGLQIGVHVQRTSFSSISGLKEQFLGNCDLLGEATTALNDLSRGLGSSMLILGEAGLGKTTLLSAVSVASECAGVLALTGRCLDGPIGLPYHAWTSIVRKALVLNDAEQDRHNELDRLALTALVPERAASESIPSELHSTLNINVERQRIVHTVEQLLRSQTEQAPILVAIDDLQFADPGSIALFDGLLATLWDAPVLILGTCRETGLHLNQALLNLARRIDSSVRGRVAHLSGLEARDIARLVQNEVGINPTNEALVSLSKRTYGNPFYVVQLVRTLRNEGRLGELNDSRGVRFTFPSYVRDAVLTDIERLPRSERSLLLTASAFKNDFAPEELAPIMRRSERQVLASMGACCDAGVLRRSPENQNRFEFSHLIIRDAIYSTLRIQKRAELHGSIATVLRSAHGDRVSLSSELAFHFYEARDVVGPDPAIKYSRRAAMQATSVSAYDQAVVHLEQARDLLECSEAPKGVDLIEILIELGTARLCVGDRDRAGEDLQLAATLAKAKGAANLLAAAAMAYAPSFLGIETGVCDPVLVQLLESAASTEDLDDRTRARLLARLALALYWDDDSAQRKEALAVEAETLCHGLDDGPSRWSVQTAVRLARFNVREPSWEVAEDSGAFPADDSSLMAALMTITSLWLRGDMNRVKSRLQDFGSVALGSLAPQSHWYPDLLRSALAIMEGRFNEAAALGESFSRVGSIMSDQNAIHSSLLQKFMVSVDTGGVERFESGIRQMIIDYPRVLGWRSGLLLLLSETGRTVEAKRVLDELVGSGALEKPERTEWYALIGPIAIAARRLGDRDTASRIGEILSRQEARLAVVGFGSYCWGPVEHLRGMCSIAQGDLVGGIASLRSAVDLCRATSALPALARACGDLGQLLDLTGAKAEARHFKDETFTIANELGMVRLRESLESTC